MLSSLTKSSAAALVSIHDVAPDVLSNVQRIIDLFAADRSEFRCELLVIPGLDWNAKQLDQLKRWSGDGHQLAGHGWHHRSSSPATLWHHIHSFCLSRDVAEHLSKSTAELKSLVTRCAEWFSTHRLQQPRLYVPPAWAMGALKRRDLDGLPFQFFENLHGYYDSNRKVVYRTPLLGYEADTRFRSFALSVFNRFNRSWSGVRGKPIRVSIHPRDLSLRLADSLTRLAGENHFQFETAADWLDSRR